MDHRSPSGERARRRAAVEGEGRRRCGADADAIRAFRAMDRTDRHGPGWAQPHGLTDGVRSLSW